MFAKLTKEQRVVAIVSIVIGGLAALLWLGLLVFGTQFTESVISGEGPFGYLRGKGLRLVPGVPEEDQSTALLQQIMTLLGRLTAVYAFCQSLLVMGSWRYPNLFSDFFSAKSYPINLAIFRIAFFLTLYPRVSLRKTLSLLQLPDESRVAPPGLGWLVANLPESPELNTWLYRLFVAACVLGVIGLWTRFACIAATLLTFHLMGITQYFGKIEHQHYLVWIGALLAVSRCADVLSVDAWLRHRSGKQTSLGHDRAYGLPIRFIWLFLGVIYFFPGMWKFVVSGPEWFLSDNLRYRMLLRMFVCDGWEPIIRMDQYPLLCKLGGLTTILMEVGFIFLIFLPGWRYVAAVGGFIFHWMVVLFLNISFWPLQLYYLTFINWHPLWEKCTSLLGFQAEPVPETQDDAEQVAASGRRLRAVFATGLIFVLGNVFCGFTMLDSWPFGVFPTFARVEGPTWASVSFSPVDESGKEMAEVEAFFDPDIRASYGVGIGRLGEILATASRPHSKRAERLVAVWEQWHARRPELQNISRVNFYLVEYSTNPDDSKEPISRKLLESVSVPLSP